MKKLSFVLAFVILVSCFAFAACGDKEEENSSASSSEAASDGASAQEPSASDEPSNEPSDEASDESADEPADEPADPVELTGEVISQGCEYEVPGGKGYVVQDDKWPANYTANLTDGTAMDQLVYNSSWFSFNTEPDMDGEANTINGVGMAIIDLGAVKTVSGAKVNICTGEASSQIAPIGSVVVSVSDDGESFSNPFKLNLPDGVVGWAEGGCAPVSARFVKVEFIKGGEGFHMFTNEISVYGN